MPMKDVWRLREKECRLTYQPQAEPPKASSSTASLPPLAAPAPSIAAASSAAVAAASLRSERAELLAREAAVSVKPPCQRAVEDSFWNPKRPTYGLRDSEATSFA